jgi:hypothetical protein
MTKRARCRTQAQAKEAGVAPFTNRDAKLMRLMEAILLKGSTGSPKNTSPDSGTRRSNGSGIVEENDISDLRFYYEILPKVAAGEEDDPLHWLKRVVQLADLDDIYDYIGFLHLVCRRPMAISILAA